ncbi:MAG: hypothetical protein JWM36_3722 [Hyphomicrobiales bacterium]|nr:hypothetical protein [Hyphomicrobiales bacterium]
MPTSVVADVQDLNFMDGFQRFFTFAAMLERKDIAFRIDRHAPDGLTVTFIFQGSCIEASFEQELMNFSYFSIRSGPHSGEAALSRLISEQSDNSLPVAVERATGVLDRCLGCLAMLKADNITYRIDQFAPDCLTVFFTLVALRVEVSVFQDRLEFVTYAGPEDVYREADLLKFFPDLADEPCPNVPKIKQIQGRRWMLEPSAISQDTASEILTLLTRHAAEMNKLIIEFQQTLGRDEFNEARRCLGTVMGESYLQAMYPLFELYPELKPEGLR